MLERPARRRCLVESTRFVVACEHDEHRTNGVAPRVRGLNLGLERLKSSRLKSVLSPWRTELKPFATYYQPLGANLRHRLCMRCSSVIPTLM